MNNKIMSYVIFFVLLSVSTITAMVPENEMIPERSQKKITRKQQREKSPSGRRKRLAAQEASPYEDARPQEEPIANMEQYVNEYDYLAKEKAVANLLGRGVDFCQKNDLKTICHAFTHTKDFVEGAMYIFLLDTKGVIYAHGDQPHLIWKNLWDKRDMFGAPIVQSMVKLAKSGGGKLAYEWDGAVKVSLIKPVTIQGKEFIIGCGYFPHSKEYAAVGLVKGAVAMFNRSMKEGHTVDVPFGDMSYPLSPQFLFGDLYLYALDFEGTIYAQGERARLIGSNALDYADASGKKYNAEIIKMLKKKEEGEGIWIDYVSKRALKHAYAEKVKDGKGKYYFIACGYYPEINRETTVDLVRKGYYFMKANGLSVATKAFTDEQNADYRYGDLGLFVYDMKGKCLANGRNPDLVGQNRWNAKDEDGRFPVQEMIAQAKAGGGWVSFKTGNSFQSTYVEKVDLGIGDFVIGTGMFPVSKPDTMRLLVKSAIGYLNNRTMDELLERLVNRADQFLRGDLYLYVLDTTGFCYGWGDNYRLIWKNLLNWKDETGKPFIKEMVDAAQHGPDNIVLHMNKCPRVNYFELIEKDKKKYIIGSGFYK